MSNKGDSYKVGEKYNMLTILEIWMEKKTENKSKISRCRCQCECGNIITIWAGRLRNGEKKSCGCKVHVCNDKHPNWKGCGEISSTKWSNIKRNSKRYGKQLEFTITIESAWELFLKQGRECALSGVEITFSKRHRDEVLEATASLDRIDSSKGYIEGNVQWVHKVVNIMKLDLDENKFIEWCNIVNKNNS